MSGSGSIVLGPGPAAGRRGESPLLEREGELRALLEAIERARRAQGSLTVIEGSAGVGKTRLLREAGAMAEAAGLRALSATAPELESEVPGALARRLLGPVLPRAAAEGSTSLLGGDPGLLASVVGAAWESDGLSGEDPAAAVTLALTALVERYLEAGHGSVAVLVDDLQWADASSLALVAHLALSRPELALMVVVTMREEGSRPPALHALLGSSRACVLHPGALSEAAVARLVRTSLPAAEGAFCEVCGRVSAGNPLLLEQLLDALAAEGTRGSGADAERLEGFVPASVLSTVLVRLARLLPGAGELARAAAIVGEAPLRIVASLAGLDGSEAEAAADLLALAGFIERGEPIRFSHPLIASAIYEDVGAFGRGRAHRRVAGLLAADGWPIAAVAAHLLRCRGEGDAWVVDTLRRAAAEALDGGAPAVAARLLERAIGEPPAAAERAEILLELADAQAACGDPGALASIRKALGLLDSPAQRARACYELAILLLARHQLPDAAACAQDGLGEAAEDPKLAGALEGVWLAAGGLVPALRERVAARQQQLREAALVGRVPEDPVACAVIALRMTNLGDDPSLIRPLLACALSPDNDPAQNAASVSHVGAALVALDDLEQAERMLTDRVELAERTGRVLTGAFARLWRANTRLRCGRLEAARRDVEWALALRAFGWQLHLAPTAAVAAEIQLAQGDLAAARATLALAAPIAARTPQPLWLKAHARVQLAAGEHEAAIADITAARDYLRTTFGLDHPGLLPWRSEVAPALARLGRPDEAVRLALEEAQIADRLASRRMQGIALAAAGTACGGERGIELLEQAAALLADTPARLEHARALLELGALQRRTRRRADARQPLRHALELATACGAAQLAERAQHELHATGARPRRTALAGIESLTDTERRIAQLAASGLSNRQIADRLVVTVRTVEWHLGRIYQKLDIHDRRELANHFEAASPQPASAREQRTGMQTDR